MMPAPVLNQIPDSLLQAGTPGIVADPAHADQVAVAQAYSDTYTAWESCASNMDKIRVKQNGLMAFKKQ